MTKVNLNKIVLQALQEDRAFQDITTRLLIGKNKTSQAYIVTKENAVICGLEIARRIFQKLDPHIQIRSAYKDGNKVTKNKKVLFLKGKTRAILSGERVALNFLSHLSGIATLTNQFVKAAGNPKVKIMDTRKTTPGWRDLERLAVKVGGGTNHRHDLADMVMVKDNHLLAVGKKMALPKIIRHLRRKTKKTLEIEVDNLVQLKAALTASPDIILLDNMTAAQLRQAVKINKQNKKPSRLEASGGISIKNIRLIAQTGVDRISIGALTHSAGAIDFSLELNN